MSFRIFSMSKSELALLYFPGIKPSSACRGLSRMIAACPPLAESLEQLGYTPSSRRLSAQQIREIVHHYGEP